MLALLLAAPALADRYWDLPPDAATAIAGELVQGTLVVTWCPQCGGDLRVMRIRAARVAPGTYDEARLSVVLERDLLFVGTNPEAPSLPESAPCGATPADWVDPSGDAELGRSQEHLDVPYSFVVDDKGRLAWLGASVAATFGVTGPPTPSPTTTVPGAFLRRIRACAKPSGKTSPER